MSDLTTPRRPRGRPRRGDPRTQEPEHTPQTDRRLPDRAEVERRRLGGPPLRPAFAHLIDLGAPGRGQLHARQMAYRIRQVLARGGWTRSEQAQLYYARNKWDRRADGKDERYNLVGTKRGRLPRTQEDLIKTATVLQDLHAFVTGVTAVITAPGYQPGVTPNPFLDPIDESPRGDADGH